MKVYIYLIPLITTDNNPTFFRYISLLSVLVFNIVLNFYIIMKFIKSIYILKLVILLSTYSIMLFSNPPGPVGGGINYTYI